MNATDILPEHLQSIVDRLLARARWGRRDALRYRLLRRRHEAARSGVIDQNYYARAQEEDCLAEYEDGLRAIWTAYQRVIAEAGIPWTADLKTAISSRIAAAAESDQQNVVALADLFLSHHHSSSRLLQDAKPSVLDSLSAEIDLFAARYQALGATLLDAVQSPRYLGPRMHWTDALAALRSSPPNGRRAAHEAVSTVEAIARIALGTPEATLGQCLKKLKTNPTVPSAVIRQIEQLWGETSNAPGVRHGSTTGTPLSLAEAEYYLGIAEASGKYLLSLDVAAS